MTLRSRRAGDWGTGPYRGAATPSVKVGSVIAGVNADYTIHLGDVYYAGTSTEESENFVDIWPAGSRGTFALNSNHEMYSGGGPYFHAVSGGKFGLQAPHSFFALENSHWIIVGLDSGYFADELRVYLDGSIGDASDGRDTQPLFLRRMAEKAKDEGKSVIVLTHHNGLSEDGDSRCPSGRKS
jgi:hypothetical protein